MVGVDYPSFYFCAPLRWVVAWLVPPDTMLEQLFIKVLQAEGLNDMKSAEGHSKSAHSHFTYFQLRTGGLDGIEGKHWRY
jgi:hypothetical protein